MPEDVRPFIRAEDRVDSLTRLLRTDQDAVATEVTELLARGLVESLPKEDGKHGAKELIEEAEKKAETEKKDDKSTEKGDDEKNGGDNYDDLIGQLDRPYVRYGDPAVIPVEILDQLVETSQVRLNTLLDRPVF